MNIKIMRFADFQFKQGEQVTVRRGTEWDIGHQHDPTRIGGAEGPCRGHIRIVDTAALQSIFHVPTDEDGLIIRHHAGWNVGQLCEFFRTQCPHWKPSIEIVTLVRFEVLELFEQAQP